MDFLENVVAPIVIILILSVIVYFAAYRFDTKTIEKIDALVNRNDLAVYENCWKLEDKYYCK